MSEAAIAVDNGVNVEALLGAREALTETPEAAKFVWRAESEWKNGTHTESKIEGFFGLGEEQRHLREFRYDTDHPEIFAAEDIGSTPVETFLKLDPPRSCAASIQGPGSSRVATTSTPKGSVSNVTRPSTLAGAA